MPSWLCRIFAVIELLGGCLARPYCIWMPFVSVFGVRTDKALENVKHVWQKSTIAFLVGHSVVCRELLHVPCVIGKE